MSAEDQLAAMSDEAFDAIAYEREAAFVRGRTQDDFRLLSEASLDATELAALRRIEEQLETYQREDENLRAAVPIYERLRSTQEQLETLERERDAIGAALGEPCVECGHIDWRSDGYADDLGAALKALAKADKYASASHDAMWAMDFDKTAAGSFERETWKRQRKQASDAIWKLHNLVRPLLGSNPATKTHGRFCDCTPCKAEDWEQIERDIREAHAPASGSEHRPDCGRRDPHEAQRECAAD